MNFRGLVLIGFSGLCLGAAGLTYEQTNKNGISQRLASITQPVRQGCMAQGIDTSNGRVGCFQPVSAAIGKAVFGKSYGGGAAMSGRAN